MFTIICVALILLFVSVVIFSFAAVMILGKILVYGAIALGIACLIKWIFD